MEKAEIIGKKIECIIGIIMLIPSIISVVAFVICIFSSYHKFYTMNNLTPSWTCYVTSFGGEYDNAAGAMSAAPIYLALMAMVGAYLIKDSVKYFFMKSK